MKIDGQFRIPAPRAEVFDRLNDPQFFASCLEGVSNLVEIDPDHFTATLETRLAYINFRFEVAVALIERVAPDRVVARLEGTPLGTVGRLTSTARAVLVDAAGGRETDILYEMEVALTGKLGSLGQPVMKSKAREMERGFVRQASAAFLPAGAPAEADAATPPARRPGGAGSPLTRARAWLAEKVQAFADRLRSDGAAAASGAAPRGPGDGIALDVKSPPAAADGETPAAAPIVRGGAARTALAFDLRQPRSLAEAISLLDTDDPAVRPFSGGTALILMMKSGVFKPSLLVDLSGLEAELGTIAGDGAGGLTIGAMVRLAELGVDEEVRRLAPVIPAAIPRLSNVRVRNAARVGGCIAHGDPHMDLPPILASLRARVQIAGPSGSRELPVDELYAGYYQTALGRGELITAVHVPAQTDWQSVYRKTTVRTYDDWPALGVAVALRREGAAVLDARVVVSAATEKVTRVPGAEQLLVGSSLDLETCREAGRIAASSVDAVSDVQGSAAYKQTLIAVEVRRALETFLVETVA